MEIKRQIDELREELISLRRDFHTYPELGFQEFRTSQIVFDYLKSLDFEVKKIAKTGVVGLLRGKNPGKTVMLRADMDALPIKEENDLPFKSRNDGIMHACGHDGHTAMLLVAAKILSKYKDEIHGNIKFVFQPNEEEAGAQIMIDEGVMENPKVDAALGLHLWSPIDIGKIGLAAGPIMASSYYFDLKILGKGGHGGSPHTAVDPIICAANIIQTVQIIQTREVSPLNPTAVVFGKMKAGSFPIIIPQEAVLQGSIRCLYDGALDVQNRFERIIKNICDAHGTSYELTFKCGNTLLSNDREITELVESVATEVVGGENIDSAVQCMLGEDFAEFGSHAPSAFYFIGVKKEEKNCVYPHHHPRFNIDEDALPIGVEMHVKTALKYLGIPTTTS